MTIRRSLLRKLIVTTTAFRRFTFWLTPKQENNIGYFWQGKKPTGYHWPSENELAEVVRDIQTKAWPVEIDRYVEWMKQHNGK